MQAQGRFKIMQLELTLSNCLEAIVIIHTSRIHLGFDVWDMQEIPLFFQRHHQFICSLMINTKSNQSTEITEEKQPKGWVIAVAVATEIPLAPKW